MHVGVDGTGGGDQPLPRDDRRAGADDDVHAVDRVRVPCAADRVDTAPADADGHLADALYGIDHQDVADHHVAGLRHGGGLEVQTVARGLPESGEELVARLLAVGLDPHHEPGVTEPDPVAGPGAVHGRVLVRIDVPAGGRAVAAVPGGSAHPVAPDGPCASAAPRYPRAAARRRAFSLAPGASRRPSTRPAKPIAVRAPPSARGRPRRRLRRRTGSTRPPERPASCRTRLRGRNSAVGSPRRSGSGTSR